MHRERFRLDFVTAGTVTEGAKTPTKVRLSGTATGNVSGALLYYKVDTNGYRAKCEPRAVMCAMAAVAAAIAVVPVAARQRRQPRWPRDVHSIDQTYETV